MRVLKHTVLSKFVIAASSLTFAVFVLVSGVALAADIPAGCPGTTIQGPGTYDCSTIPLGCPGTTVQGPVASPPKNCPFAAATPVAAQPTVGSCDGLCKVTCISGYTQTYDSTKPNIAGTDGPSYKKGDDLSNPAIICGGAGNVASIVKVKNYCGSDPKVETAISIGCVGKGNPVLDMAFAVLRLLSQGVGLVIVGSIIIGGIQYTTSAGDPQAAAKAVGRIRATLIALGLYIFAYPLLNYLLPLGFFK